MRNLQVKTPNALLTLTVALLLLAACGGEEQQAVEATQITFTTADGVTLSGNLFSPVQGSDIGIGVVLSHMFPADQRSWWGFAQVLQERGYAALTYDVRGYRESEGRKEISKIHLDVEAALTALRETGVGRVFLVGASMGGAASLIVGARQEVAGVVTLSAPAEFRGLDARPSVSEVRAPKLFIAGEGDTSAAKSVTLLESLAPLPKDILLVSTGAHGTDLLKKDSRSEVDQAILEFLERNR